MDARLANKWTVRLVRIAALAFAAALIHFAFHRDEHRDSSPGISLHDAQLVFPAAQKLRRQSGQRHAYAVIAESGATVGSVLVTSPEADDLIGYSGPSNLIVGLTPDGRVQAVRLLSSRDTPAHVGEVEGT